MGKTKASDLFIVDNSDSDWKVRSYLTEWCELSKAIDIATGYFEIGSLLALGEKWQAVDRIRILMGDEVSMRTKRAFGEGLRKIAQRLDDSLEAEKAKNDFLAGVPAIVAALRSGRSSAASIGAINSTPRLTSRTGAPRWWARSASSGRRTSPSPGCAKTWS